MAKPRSQTLTGLVARVAVGEGSKSAHQAVVLQSTKGEYELRREGGNPFYDPELVSLVGKTIQGRGVVDDYVFTLADWEEVDK